MLTPASTEHSRASLRGLLSPEVAPAYTGEEPFSSIQPRSLFGSEAATNNSSSTDAEDEESDGGSWTEIAISAEGLHRQHIHTRPEPASPAGNAGSDQQVAKDNGTGGQCKEIARLLGGQLSSQEAKGVAGGTRWSGASGTAGIQVAGSGSADSTATGNWAPPKAAHCQWKDNPTEGKGDPRGL